jgi:large subunit ribosomal protein L21
MYAVIETGGKQYRVEVGTVLEVEHLDAEPGGSITLDRVLLVADGDEAAIGRPLVEGASVSADVVRQARADKVIVFKYKPKARRRVKKGHRQELTVLRISDISFKGRSAAAETVKAGEAKKTERERLEEAAARQAAADAELAAKLAARDAETAEVKAPAKSRRAKATAADTGAEESLEKEPAPKRSRSKASKAVATEPAEADEAAEGVAAADETADAEPAKDAPKPRRRSTKKDE